MIQVHSDNKENFSGANTQLWKYWPLNEKDDMLDSLSFSFRNLSWVIYLNFPYAILSALILLHVIQMCSQLNFMYVFVRILAACRIYRHSLAIQLFWIASCTVRFYCTWQELSLEK